MNYRDTQGRLLAQKFRTPEKAFSWVGRTKDQQPLYGQWLWPSRGKSVVITEGELDAMSVSKAFQHKWPVVSLPDGAQSAARTLKACYEWLVAFEKVVLWFDADEAGQTAVDAAVQILPPGKAWIVRNPEGCKDASDVLVKLGPDVVVKAFWNAQPWRPDGIREGREFTRETLKKAIEPGYELPWPDLQARLYGIRKREVTLLTAGPGIGKSTLARELAYHLRTQHGCKIGNIFLEESNSTTATAYVALHNNVALDRLSTSPDSLSDAQWDSSLAAVVHEGMWFYDHFGSIAVDILVQKITYLAKVCAVDFIVLDHISIVVSGDNSGEGERRDIDILMTKLAQTCQATGVGIIAIVHLKRKQGVSFNEGGQISLNDLRGSAGLEQLAHNVIGLERDQQADGDKACIETVRVLKCRLTGRTGLADTIRYDRETGRLLLVSPFDQPDNTEAMHEF